MTATSAGLEREAIVVRNLSLTYSDGTEAVRSVGFTVPAGEFFGFLGPNGAGKTTTIKMLITLLQPTSGELVINGFDSDESPRAIRASVGYTSQETSVDPQLTARENLVLACELYHVPKSQRDERVRELLDLVELEEVADKQAETFSGGMKKRLDIATSLVHEPTLLFLDEPTTGLDPRSRLRLWEYFERINDDGTTIFLTTQNLEEADYLCSKLGVINDGELVTVDAPDSLKSAVGGEALEITLDLASQFGPTEAEDEIRRSEILTDSDSVGTTATGVVISSPYARRIGPDVLSALNDAGATVTEFSVRSPSLDDVFLELTGQTLDDASNDPPDSSDRVPANVSGVRTDQ